MSMNVNQDYSQFYAGTEQIKSYGSNLAAKKDTLVKYRFSTTDEHGNKVMDKMSASSCSFPAMALRLLRRAGSPCPAGQ